MDYAYAPGETLIDDYMRAMLERRSNTTTILARPGANLIDFISDLNKIPVPPPATHLVDNFLLCSHAFNEGVLDASMFPNQSDQTFFETIEETLTDPSKSIVIPDALIGYNQGDPITHFFHIKGCNIGKAVPFLTKFKQALGNHVNVTAPIHFHGVIVARDVGVFEYMAYKFQIVRRTAFPDKASAVTAFTNRTDFKLIDGTVVPNTLWRRWIPNDITKTDSRRISFRLGRTIRRRRTLLAEQEFQVVDPQTIYGKFEYTMSFRKPAMPPTQTVDQEKALQISVNANTKFSATHPFPVHTRFGYASIADFLAGYNWTFHTSNNSTDPNLTDLVCTGQRYQYIMMVPIKDIATGSLIFNFHPNRGSGLQAVPNGLRESDTRFFATI
jgi:hypothetical protein